MCTLTTTSTRFDGVYMQSISKQQQHRREAPAIFEGNNKSDTTTGSTTPFKNWATAKLQIYMSLEDHKTTDIMDKVKQETIPIIDIDYVEHELEKRNPSTTEADKWRATELQRLIQIYNDANRDALQRNAARRARRARNEQTEDDEVLPRPPELPKITSHSPTLRRRLSMTAQMRSTITADYSSTRSTERLKANRA
eukprot:2408971-Amphidinium_carterae.1